MADATAPSTPKTSTVDNSFSGSRKLTTVLKKRKHRREKDKARKASEGQGLESEESGSLLASQPSFGSNSDVIVLPSQSQSLPWCLYVKQDEFSRTPYPGSATDFVVRNVFAEFKVVTTAVIRDVIDSVQDASVFCLASVFKNRKLYDQVTTSLAKMGVNTLNFVLGALMQWRAYQYESSKRATKGYTKDQLPLLDERLSNTIEYIFAATTLKVLDRSAENTPDEKLCEELEALVIDGLHYRADKADRATAQMATNRRVVQRLSAGLVARMSEFRFSKITEKLLDGIGNTLSSHSTQKKQSAQTNAKIDGMRLIRLQLSSQRKVDEAVEFLKRYNNFLKTPKLGKDKETRLVLSQTLVYILRQAIQEERRQEVDYTDFNRLLVGMYDTFSANKKRTKDIYLQTWYPLLAVVLCLVDREFFSENWMSLITQLGKHLKEKSTSLRTLTIESIAILVEAYRIKCGEDDQKTIQSNLTSVMSVVFLTGQKKQTFIVQGESVRTLELFADVILLISKMDLDFAVRKIIFDLMRSDKLRGDTQPEKVHIAVLALDAMFSTLKKKGEGEKEGEDENEGEEAPIRESSRKPTMESFLPSICDFISQLLVSLDGMFGRWLASTHSRTATELLQREKLPIMSMELLKSCISLIPPAIPSSLSPPELVALLGRYQIHVDKDLRERSSAQMCVLMRTSPQHRPHIVLEMAHLILRIPDKKNVVLSQMLKQLHLFLEMWIVADGSGEEQRNAYEEIKTTPTSSINLDEETAKKIEATAVLCLCSPDGRVRASAYHVLEGIRELCKGPALEGEGERKTRVMDILDESGDDIVLRMRRDVRFTSEIIRSWTWVAANSSASDLHKARAQGQQQEIPQASDQDCNLVSFLTSERSAHQLCWSYCLGELIFLTSELCPQVLSTLSKVLASRVDDSTKSIGVPGEPEFTMHLWRNYVVLAAITARPGDDNALSSAKGVFSLIANHLKVDSFREAAVMALERAHPSCFGVLVEVLKPYALECTGKKTKRLRERLRTDLSSIYSHVVQSLAPGELAANEKARKLIIEHVEFCMSYLSTWDQADDASLLRYNFCTTVECLATQLSHLPQPLLSKGLRKKMFLLLAYWTVVSDEECDSAEEAGPEVFQPSMPRKLTTNKKVTPSNSPLVQLIQLHMCKAAAALLRGPFFSENPLTPEAPSLLWVKRMLKSRSSHRELFTAGVQALEGMFGANAASTDLLHIALDHCYSSDPQVANGYFLAFVELYRNNGEFLACSPGILLNLILYKLAGTSKEIREGAIYLLQVVGSRRQVQEDEEEEGSFWADDYFPSGIASDLFEIYEQEQMELSRRLSDDYPELALDVFIEMVFRLDSAATREQKLMLSYAVPWLKKVHMANLDSARLSELLQNLYWLTVKFVGKHHYSKIVDVWETLAMIPSNINSIVDLTLSMGTYKRNPSFVKLAKRALVYLARRDRTVTVDALVSELSTLTRVKKKGANLSSSSGVYESWQAHEHALLTPEDEENSDHMERSPFHLLMPEISDFLPPARGHLALMLLAEISFLPYADALLPHLPVLLHQCFLGVDANSALVYDHCRILLQNLLQLAAAEVSDPLWYERRELEEFLQSFAGKPLWQREDICTKERWIRSAQQLKSLVERVVRVLGPSFAGLEEKWGTEALAWAVSCPVIHWRCRSLQIYRCLNIEAQGDALSDILSSLVRFLAPTGASNTCGVLLEIISTLEVTVTKMDSSRLVLFNQIFWAAVALLHSDYAVIFESASLLLLRILDRVNFAEKAVQHVFLASRPTQWTPPFIGIQPLLLKGLLDEKTAPVALELLVSIAGLPLDEIFQPDENRVLTNLIAVQPWLCSALGDSSALPQCFAAADTLSIACRQRGLSALSQVYARVQTSYQSVGVFIEEWAAAFAVSFFPSKTWYTVTVLLELLQNGARRHSKAVLWIIGALLAHVDLNGQHFSPFFAQWLGVVSQSISSANWRESLQCLTNAAHQGTLTSQTMDTKKAKPFRSYAAPPCFTNEMKNGNMTAGRCLEAILSGSDGTKSENVISPRAFSKFFSEDDMNILLDNTIVEQAGSGTGTGTYEDEYSRDCSDSDEECNSGNLRGRLRPSERPISPRGWPGLAGGFPSFKGYDDILSDLQREELGSPEESAPPLPPAQPSSPAPSTAPVLSLDLHSLHDLSSHSSTESLPLPSAIAVSSSPQVDDKTTPATTAATATTMTTPTVTVTPSTTSPPLVSATHPRSHTIGGEAFKGSFKKPHSLSPKALEAAEQWYAAYHSSSRHEASVALEILTLSSLLIAALCADWEATVEEQGRIFSKALDKNLPQASRKQLRSALLSRPPRAEEDLLAALSDMPKESTAVFLETLGRDAESMHSSLLEYCDQKEALRTCGQATTPRADKRDNKRKRRALRACTALAFMQHFLFQMYSFECKLHGLILGLFAEDSEDIHAQFLSLHEQAISCLQKAEALAIKAKGRS